ncbi:MAG: HAD family hydrolase [Promethearchaeota archaeon]|jgi:HAD superfamily hydrolase (TIGR01549 family)
MGIKAIVWDMDGTLIHFQINSTKARRAAISILSSHGIEKRRLSIKKSILDNITISKEIFKQRGYTLNQIDLVLKEIDIAVSKIEYRAALNASIIGGIEDVLIFAQRKNLKQAIFTFNKYNHAKISLEKAKILKYFNVIVGRDNIENPKPHPDHLLDICQKLKVNPTEVLVIGDNFRDIECALNVGAHSIAVHTKLAVVESLHKADKIIKEEEIPIKLINEIEKLL